MTDTIRVEIVDARPRPMLTVPMILPIVPLVYFWQWTLATIGVALVVTIIVVISRRAAAKRRAILENLDQQSHWLAEGDPRGVYGADWRPGDAETRP